LSFGPFELFPGQRLLVEGNNQIQLGNRALDILTVLVERAGRVVPKELLTARMLSSVLVEEGNLRIGAAPSQAS
jgi:DNA-binding winged helix-turn-helix (wHTH) protein